MNIQIFNNTFFEVCWYILGVIYIYIAFEFVRAGFKK